MSNLINDLIKSAQEIVINVACPLSSSSHSDDQKKIILEDAAKRMNLLFEKNREIVRVSKDLSLEEQAIEYVKNHPILKPFFSQLFPEIQFPKVTQVFVKCDTGFESHLTIRGSPPLDWKKGIRLENRASDLWEYREETDLRDFEYKIVFNDEETGWEKKDGNHLSEEEQMIVPDFTHFGVKKPSKIERQKAQLFNILCSAQSAFQEIKQQYLTQKQSDCKGLLSKIKSKIVPIFESSFSLVKNGSYPEYFSPFISQWFLIILDQQLEEIKDEFKEELNRSISNSVKSKLKLLAHIVYTFPYTWNLLFSKIQNLPFHQRLPTEIFKIIAKRNAREISERIQDYGFNEQQRFEIATIIASGNGNGVSQFIKNYDLNEQQRFEVAKTVAFQNAEDASEYIQKYDLNKQQRFEIAKIAAARNTRNASECIQKYNLNERQRFEVAKIAATQNGGDLSERIQNYNLNEQQRFEVAKISAAQNGGGTSEHIQKYNLNEQQRFEVAKISAAQNGGGTSEHIQKYNLNEQQRFEIAKIAAAQNGGRASTHIVKYDFKNPKQLFQIFTIALLQDPMVLTLFSNYNFHLTALCEVFNLLAEDNENTSKVMQKLQEFAKNKEWDITPFIEKILKLKNTKVQKESLTWLTHLLIASSLENLSKSQFHELFICTGFIESVISLHSPILRYTLSRATLQYTQNSTAQDFSREPLSKCRQNIFAYERLSILFVSLLFSQKISSSICHKLLKISQNNQFKKDEKLLRKWLESMDKIIQEPGLNFEDKEYLFLTLINQSTSSNKERKTKEQTNLSTFLEKLSLCSTILELKEIEVLKKSALLKQSNLSATLEELFISHLPIRQFENFANLYQEHFAKARTPHYIMTYIAKIQHSSQQEKKKLVDALICCVEAILEGNLAACRYNLESSVHLKTVFSERENLFEEWKKGDTCSLNTFLQECSSQKQKLEKLPTERFPCANEFKTDIQTLLNSVKIQELQKYNDWTIRDTDDAQDMFLCGTETGSCQRIAGDISYNKCLLNFLLDGKIRILVIKDGSGKIRARHLFRMLWDKDQPVLFLEPLYPNTVAPELKNALTQFGQRRAHALGLPLLQAKPSNERSLSYGRSIESLGSRAPFDYTDAEGIGVVLGGCFQVSKAFLVDQY